MLFKLTFDVRYVDGSSSAVTTRPATDVAFERRFDRTLMSVFTENLPLEASQALQEGSTDPAHTRALLAWVTTNMRTEWTYFLAWHAARTGDDFDTWLDRVDEINWEFAGPARVDPTQPAAPAN